MGGLGAKIIKNEGQREKKKKWKAVERGGGNTIPLGRQGNPSSGNRPATSYMYVTLCLVLSVSLKKKKKVLVCPISSILDLASLRPKGGFAPDVSLYTSISTRVYLIQYNECH